MNSAKLAAAVRDIKETCKEILYDADIDNQEVTDGIFLLSVLANIVDGKPIAQAFGSPGDWGYNTPIGKALAEKGA